MAPGDPAVQAGLKTSSAKCNTITPEDHSVDADANPEADADANQDDQDRKPLPVDKFSVADVQKWYTVIGKAWVHTHKPTPNVGVPAYREFGDFVTPKPEYPEGSLDARGLFSNGGGGGGVSWYKRMFDPKEWEAFTNALIRITEEVLK